MVFGAPRAEGSSSETNRGETVILYGGDDVAPAILSVDGSSPPIGDPYGGTEMVGVDTNDESGSSVAAVGDFNDDSYPGFLIGAPLADPNGNTSAGTAYLVMGSTNTPLSIAKQQSYLSDRKN